MNALRLAQNFLLNNKMQKTEKPSELNKTQSLVVGKFIADQADRKQIKRSNEANFEKNVIEFKTNGKFNS